MRLSNVNVVGILFSMVLKIRPCLQAYRPLVDDAIMAWIRRKAFAAVPARIAVSQCVA